MSDEAATLDESNRALVTESIVETARLHPWLIFAVQVRIRHVHVVVQATGEAPEEVMRRFKAYASRQLNLRGRKRWWSRHGNTKYLWNLIAVEAATRYVVEEQGEPMALYVPQRSSVEKTRAGTLTPFRARHRATMVR